MTEKPRFEVCLSDDAQSPLEAVTWLSRVANEKTFYLSHNTRPPLGIYNISVGRVCQKVAALCERMEEYIRRLGTRLDGGSDNKLEEELVDYIELVFYATAEHVDDIKLISSCFYQSSKVSKSSKARRKLINEIDGHKKFISAIANAIKHSQSRIRLFSCECKYNSQGLLLHGYFVEGIRNGEVRPHPVFHGQDGSIFSITTLVWESIVLLLRCSRSLAEYLSGKNLTGGSIDASKSPIQSSVIAAARLPLYTFDDTHPFSQTTLGLKWDAEWLSKGDSGILGSIRSPWPRGGSMQFGSDVCRYAGDGISRTFAIAGPKKIGLQHWE